MFFSHVNESERTERSPDDLIIRCGEYDLRNDTIEKYPNQDRYVETFSIDPFYTGRIKGNNFLWHDVGVIHTTEPFNQGILLLPGTERKPEHLRLSDF